MFITDLSIKRPVLMTMFLAFFIVMGIFTYLRLPVEMLPKVEIPIITVLTVYPGAAPAEIETQITKKLEDAVSSVNGLKHLKSVTQENVSNLILEFNVGIDVDNAATDVRDKIELVKNNLPDDAEAPKILKFDINEKPVATLIVSGNKTPNEIWNYVDEKLKDEVSKIDGVASVDVYGGEKREINVLISQDKLRAHNLSIDFILKILAANNFEMPAGYITEKKVEYNLKFLGKFRSLREIENIEIPLAFGNKIKLKRLADIKDTFKESRTLIKLNKKPGVSIVVMKKSDANTIKLVQRIKKQLPYLKKLLPENFTIKLARDNSTFIKNSIDDVNSNLILGTIITAIILFLFLHSFKTTFIAAISMPASIIATFTLVYFANFTLNVMSLMALAISVGILVNNSIIILENITTHFNRGKTAEQAANEGTDEIAVAVAGATLTNVVVFVPIAFMKGVVGQFFLQFGMTVTFATLFSLLIAYTMIPMLSAKMFKDSDRKSFSAESKGFIGLWEKLYNSFEKDYKSSLFWALNNKAIIITVTIIIFISSFFIAPYLGSEFVTKSDSGEIFLFGEMPEGTPINETEKTFSKMENIIKVMPEVKLFYTQIGKSENAMLGSSEGTHLGQIFLKLTKEGKPSTKFINKLRMSLKNIPSIKLSLKEADSVGGSDAKIQLEILGPEFEKVKVYNKIILEIVKNTAGTIDVETSLKKGKPEVQIIPDRIKFAEFGFTSAQMAQILRTNIYGIEATKYKENGEEYDIRVKLKNEDKKRIEQIKNILVQTPKGNVYLKDIAKINLSRSPSKILRKNKNQMVQINSEASGRSPGRITEEIAAKIKKIKLDPGYTAFFAGEAERQGEAFTELLTAFILAITFTYMLLAGLLESFIHPLIIMMTLPLALIGVFVGLLITEKTISIFSLMAVIMLVGIVVNNGILLIDYTEILRKRGYKLLDAITEACPARFRAIIMTAVTAIFAMIPQALEMGDGGEMRSPMAIVSIAGLCISTLLSLYLIPILYYLVENFKNKGNK